MRTILIILIELFLSSCYYRGIPCPDDVYYSNPRLRDYRFNGIADNRYYGSNYWTPNMYYPYMNNPIYIITPLQPKPQPVLPSQPRRVFTPTNPTQNIGNQSNTPIRKFEVPNTTRKFGNNK